MSEPKTKPYHYKLVAAEFLAQICEIPAGGHEKWVRTLALDLVRAEGSTDYAKALITEVAVFRKAKADSGALGGEAKARNAKDQASKT